MSEASREYTATGSVPESRMPTLTSDQESAWASWVVFGGTMLVILGGFHIIEGLVAVFRDEVFVVGQRGLVVNVDYTAWGWIHILGGGFMILIGACLIAGQMWARIFAVIIAGLSAFANIAFLPAYPVWSAIMIALDVIIIWAVIVHGSELKHPPGWDGKDV